MTNNMTPETMNEFIDYITDLNNDDAFDPHPKYRTPYVIYHDLNDMKTTGRRTIPKIISDMKVKNKLLWLKLKEYANHIDCDIKYFIINLLRWIVLERKEKDEVLFEIKYFNSMHRRSRMIVSDKYYNKKAKEFEIGEDHPLRQMFKSVIVHYVPK